MNPCNCGYYPDMNRCSCTPGIINKYMSKISQPLLDRIDISIETPQVSYNDLESKKETETSAIIKERIIKAKKIQKIRYNKENINFNSQLTPAMMKKYCILGKEEHKLLELSFAKLNLTARSYHRIIKVARTIADLDNSEEIQRRHISEAICYRSIDKKSWINAK